MIQCITYHVSQEVSSKTIWSPASILKSFAGVASTSIYEPHKPKQSWQQALERKRQNRSVRINESPFHHIPPICSRKAPIIWWQRPAKWRRFIWKGGVFPLWASTIGLQPGNCVFSPYFHDSWDIFHAVFISRASTSTHLRPLSAALATHRLTNAPW